MGYSLNFRASLVSLFILFLLKGNILAQPKIVARNKQEFLHFILTDIRNEPNFLIFNIHCNNYNGPVIVDPGYFGLFLIQSGELDTLPNLVFAEQRLMVESAIFLKSNFNECCKSIRRPPRRHRFYRVENDVEYLLKKFTIYDESVDRWKLNPYMKRRDVNAFIYVMFNHQVPIYENGYGYWIDTLSIPYYLLEDN